MRIHITATEFDPVGRLVIDALPSSDVRSVGRRVNRVPTLDLGAAVNDRGFSHADRTFRIRWQSTKASNDAVAYLLKTHNRVNVSTDEGVFLAVIETFQNVSARESELVLLITERLGP